MKALLKVFTRTVGDQYETYWTTGRKQGVIAVDLAPSITDNRPIVAELSALHYLLSYVGIMGRDRTGESLAIEVSFGAIRKLISPEGAAKSSRLIPYARFLNIRFAEAEIAVAKDGNWIIPARAAARRETLSISEPLPEMLQVTGYGNVSVSVHIIERMLQKANYASASAVWKHLRRMLDSHALVKKVLPAQVAAHKAEKYGENDVGDHIRHLREPWTFVIAPIREPNSHCQNVLTTAYVRASEFLQP